MSLDEKIKEIMSSVFEVSKESISEECSSDSIAEWDSLKHMNLILALEEEFNVEIPDDEVGDLTSFRLVKLSIQELL